MKLVLFDIDGTLINTGGAGSVSMKIAFQQVWGIQDGFKNIFMMGKTDPVILREALKNHNLMWDTYKIDQFRKNYFHTLKKEIKKDRPGKRICPGIVPLLQLLHKRDDFILSLLTGNYAKSAFIKLEHFNINTFFQNGAFSDDTEKREEMVPIIQKKIENSKNIKLHNDDMYVIGDTPSDIKSAQKNKVNSIGVATGVHTLKELQSYRPDYLLKNLSDTARVLKVLKG